jgi:hypothetical protein
MAELSVERFMAQVLADEGWMSGLSSDAVAAVIARLEAALPPDASLSAERASHIRAALRELGDLGQALSSGTLHEARLVEGWLRLLEV